MVCISITDVPCVTLILYVGLAKNAISVSVVGNDGGSTRFTVFAVSLHLSSVDVGATAGNRIQSF